MLADDGAQGGVEVACLRAEGGVAEALREGGGVGDVGEKDGSNAGRESGHAAGRPLGQEFVNGVYQRVWVGEGCGRRALKKNQAAPWNPRGETLGDIDVAERRLSTV